LAIITCCTIISRLGRTALTGLTGLRRTRLTGLTGLRGTTLTDLPRLAGATVSRLGASTLTGAGPACLPTISWRKTLRRSACLTSLPSLAISTLDDVTNRSLSVPFG